MPGVIHQGSNFSSLGPVIKDPVEDRFRKLIARLSNEQELSRLSVPQRLAIYRQALEMGHVETMVPILPLLFNHEGKPYSLDHHGQMEPLFRTRLPKQSVLMGGRQFGKSLSNAVSSVALATLIPNFKQMFITPLFEQVRRLSNNYVRPLIEESPVKNLMQSSGMNRSVLQRTFSNKSILQFTFAYLDASRTRGATSDFNRYDEVQLINPDFFSIINETMSHSPYGVTQYAGTPLTPTNVLNVLYQQSSSAEWHVPCEACGHWSIPSLQHDLLAMLGDYSPDICEDRPGVVCAKCKRPIFPHKGRWVHRFPDRRYDSDGYHVPQPVIWIHYSRHDKWAELLAKQRGGHGFTPDRFNNEVLGEPSGTGAQLISLQELKQSCTLPWKNVPAFPPEDIRKRKYDYKHTLVSIDWGGGGQVTTRGGEKLSLTAIAYLGYKPSGRIDVLWGCKLYTPLDHFKEAADVRAIWDALKPDFLVHDYTGAGTARETFLAYAGVPAKRIIPITLIGAATAGLIEFKPATQSHPRNHWQLDKSRALLMTINAIKFKKIAFFECDYIDMESPGLIAEFESLIEEKVTTRHRHDTYSISRRATQSDDFAHAVNFGCQWLWKIEDSYPTYNDIDYDRYKITDNILDAIDITPNNGGWGAADKFEADFDPYSADE